MEAPVNSASMYCLDILINLAKAGLIEVKEV